MKFTLKHPECLTILNRTVATVAVHTFYYVFIIQDGTTARLIG